MSIVEEIMRDHIKKELEEKERDLDEALAQLNLASRRYNIITAERDTLKDKLSRLEEGI